MKFMLHFDENCFGGPPVTVSQVHVSKQCWHRIRSTGCS
jgi:hypothetical protein